MTTASRPGDIYADSAEPGSDGRDASQHDDDGEHWLESSAVLVLDADGHWRVERPGRLHRVTSTPPPDSER